MKDQKVNLTDVLNQATKITDILCDMSKYQLYAYVIEAKYKKAVIDYDIVDMEFATMDDLTLEELRMLAVKLS